MTDPRRPSDGLPPLPYAEWEPTKTTLHLWAQIVGKTKLALAPMRNHWWNVTLRPSVRGITTGRIGVDTGSLEIELDLTGHRLWVRTRELDDGFPLVDGLSVADFHGRLVAILDGLGIAVPMRSVPFGVPVTTPFADDHEHASYDADAAGRFLEILHWSADVLEEFAGWYTGKTSPVHVFWHGFDLAVTRFSGRRAPVAPEADRVTAEAYSHEVISFGFWAGDEQRPFPSYYSYTAPEPAGLREQPLRPAAARWLQQGTGSLAVLPYDDVRAAADPTATLLEFLQSTFEAGGSLAAWDLLDTATAWCPVPPDRLAELTLRSRKDGAQ